MYTTMLLEQVVRSEIIFISSSIHRKISLSFSEKYESDKL